jgi:DNA replication and repair protein RecF
MASLASRAFERAPILRESADARGRVAVTRLTVTDFRNYARLRLDLGPECAVLTGPNGAGKTNLLEALSFLAPGKGLRRAKLSEPDRRASDGISSGAWTVAATVETESGATTIGTGHEGESGGAERRVVRIDGAARSQKDLAETLSIVWLTPEMDRLFMDGPSGRRRFLDRLVFSFDPEHASRVAAYEQCLRERARLLAEGRTDPAWLDALEDGMARHGVAVAAARAAVAARIDRAAAEGIGPFPSARVATSGDVDSWLAEMPALSVEDRLRAALATSRAQDAHMGGASAGPHRADMEVRFAAKDRPACECSTGEQKALLLSIVLAVARELVAERGRPPLLLLDEVVAHLDGARRAALFDELTALGAQAWLAGTDDELFGPLRGRAQFFRVLDANVTPR